MRNDIVTGVRNFSEALKAAALRGSLEVVGVGGKVVVGGKAIVEFAAVNLASGGEDGNGGVSGMLLINTKGFVEGIGPISFLSACCNARASRS